MDVLLIIFVFVSLLAAVVAWKLFESFKRCKQAHRKTLQERQIVLSFLHRIGSAFTESIDLDGLLDSVVRCSLDILKAASGALFLVDDSKSFLQARIIEGVFPPWYQLEKSVLEKVLTKTEYLERYLKAQKIPIGQELIGTVATTSRSCLVSDASVDARIPRFREPVLQIRTMLLVPLKIRDEVLGVLALVNKEDEQSFTETDLNLLEALGDQAAIAIRNAKFYKTVVEKHKLDRDLSIAKDIQRMLLPKECPVIDNWDLAVWSKSAMEIGGDYYDFIDVGKNKLGVAIADVAGKSIPGALVMSMTRSILRSKAVGIHSASSLLMAVNELVCQDIDPDMFISLLYLVIDTRFNEVTYGRAGHEPLILYRARQGACEVIKAEGMVLGMDDGPLFNNSLREINLRLEPGDIIVLYTDGITEAVNEKEEEFDLKNLIDAVRISNQGSASSIVANIAQRISRFTGNIPQQDDLTLLVLKVKGSEAVPSYKL